MLIGKYLTLEECCKSATAIRLNIANKPTGQQIIAMQTVASKVYDKICEHFLLKIPVTSFYRSVELNSAISGSSRTSQHCRGEAMDLDLDRTMNGVTNKMMFDYIRQHLDFDQLIWEFGTLKNPDWVHVSYDVAGKNRKNILMGLKENGKTVYKPIIY